MRWLRGGARDARAPWSTGTVSGQALPRRERRRGRGANCYLRAFPRVLYTQGATPSPRRGSQRTALGLSACRRQPRGCLFFAAISMHSWPHGPDDFSRAGIRPAPAGLPAQPNCSDDPRAAPPSNDLMLRAARAACAPREPAVHCRSIPDIPLLRCEPARTHTGNQQVSAHTHAARVRSLAAARCASHRGAAVPISAAPTCYVSRRIRTS